MFDPTAPEMVAAFNKLRDPWYNEIPDHYKEAPPVESGGSEATASDLLSVGLLDIGPTKARETNMQADQPAATESVAAAEETTSVVLIGEDSRFPVKIEDLPTDPDVVEGDSMEFVSELEPNQAAPLVLLLASLDPTEVIDGQPRWSPDHRALILESLNLVARWKA